MLFADLLSLHLATLLMLFILVSIYHAYTLHIESTDSRIYRCNYQSQNSQVVCKPRWHLQLSIHHHTQFPSLHSDTPPLYHSN